MTNIGDIQQKYSVTQDQYIESNLSEQETEEKKELLYKIWKFKQLGFTPSKQWSIKDNIYELRFEYHKLKTEYYKYKNVLFYDLLKMIFFSTRKNQ